MTKKIKILAVAAAAVTTLVGLGATAMVFADDIDQTVAALEEGAATQDGNTDSASWYRGGWGYRGYGGRWGGYRGAGYRWGGYRGYYGWRYRGWHGYGYRGVAGRYHSWHYRPVYRIVW